MCERKNRAAEPLSCNRLVQIWPEIKRLAQSAVDPQQTGLLKWATPVSVQISDRGAEARTLMMSDIAERQNSPDALKRLAAQRWLYGKAKDLAGWRLGSGLLAVALLASVPFVEWEPHRRLATIVVVLLWFLDHCALIPWAEKKKQEAAAIQEDFDCIVLDLPWPEHSGVERPTDDRVKELATTADWRAARGDLAHWYSVADIPADPIAARLHCQRANCRWDSGLRSEWTLLVTTAVAVVAALAVATTSLAGVTVFDTVLAFAAGLRLAWLVPEVRGHFDARKRVGRLHRFLSRAGKRAEDQTLCDVRLVQARIFEHRRLSPTVPDWFFNWKKQRYEAVDSA